MREYRKPAVVMSGELAESVYMASGSAVEPGDASSGQGSVTVNATISGSDGASMAWFQATITNNSDSDIEGWSASITFDGPVRAVQLYAGCNVSFSGNTITITPAESYNYTLKAHASVDCSGCVTGDTVLALA